MFLLKSIPQVDKFILDKAFETFSKPLVTRLSKEVLQSLRERILDKTIDSFTYESLINEVLSKYEALVAPSLHTLVNATGIIVHTNLGRSLIGSDAFDRIKSIATHYNNLEYDMQKGKRGERYSHISKVICTLLECEDVLIVNNNASAVFLILNTFAQNKEVIVSRGELVEIGGSFRIPDVMRQSGAKLVEIGTTNKTHRYDYENAINEETAMVMKVHKSNYSIEGFSSDVAFEELIPLAQEAGVIDYYDMGSGHLIDLPYGLDAYEPSVSKYMKHKPSLLSFSGDKLLGSVQAGIIVGKKAYIQKLKKNPLLRMLRVDKITLALLEDNVTSILLGKHEEIPTLKMLFTPMEVLRQRAQMFIDAIGSVAVCEMFDSKTLIGGGTTPNKTIPTVVVSMHIKNYKAQQLEKLFRAKKIIGRIKNDNFLLDFRSIQEDEISVLIDATREICHA